MSKSTSQRNFDVANLTVSIIASSSENKKVILDGNAIKNHVFMRSITDNLQIPIDDVFDHYTTLERLTRYVKETIRDMYSDIPKEDLLDPNIILGIYPCYGENSALNAVSKKIN